MGKEMNVVYESGKAKFNEDLSNWAECFMNGRYYTVRVAGSGSVKDEFNSTIYPEGKSYEIFDPDYSDVFSQETHCSLEDWIERNRLKLIVILV